MSIYDKEDTGRIAEPEWIGRSDLENGQWDVQDCEARRGIPATSVVERIMFAPRADTPSARVIRAHEMMHAKVSPAGEWEQWQSRKIASKPALIIAEELRVNYLCRKAGFDVLSHLTDGTETADGERVACTNDWKSAVHMAIATAGTASSKPYLNGVRRHNRLWGKALLSVSKRAIKEMDKAHNTGKLASTAVEPRSGLAPLGFIFTEKMAEWIDRLAGMPPKEEEEEVKESSSTKLTDAEDSGKGIVTHSNIGKNKPREFYEQEYLDKISHINPETMSKASTPYWGELVVEKLPLTIVAKGNLGKKKMASNVGRAPRRLHRYMSDPQRRIFDNKKKGMGGVVVIDASGSMTLTRDDVRQMLDASPGCTVLAYSDIGEGNPNAWVLADKGRMVADHDFPSMSSGNGVDFPALEWGVNHKQHSSSPVIWVTDGGVCGPNQGFSEMLANQCTSFCIDKKVTIVEDATTAIEILGKLKSRTHFEKDVLLPRLLRESWGNR